MVLNRVPRTTKQLSLVFLVYSLGINTTWKFLPIFFEQHIDSVFLIGILTSLPAIVTILMDVPVSNLVQQAGEHIIIFLGIVAWLFPAILYLTAIPLLLALGKFFEGISKTLIWNGGWSLAMKTGRKGAKSEALAVFMFGIHLTLVISPVIGGYIIATHGFTPVFWLWITTVLLALPLYLHTLGIKTKQPLHTVIKRLVRKSTYSQEFSHLRQHWSQLRLPFTMVLIYSIVFSFFWLAVPLLLSQLGADFITMGLIFGLAAVPNLFEYLFGRLADSYGQFKTIAVMSLSMIPVLIYMGLEPGIYIIGGLFLTTRLLSWGMQPAIHAVFDAQAPDHIESELTGFFELFKHIGQATGPFMAGTVASLWGLGASFHAAAIVSGLLFLFALYGIKTLQV